MSVERAVPSITRAVGLFFERTMYSIHKFGYETIIERDFLQYCGSPVSALLFNPSYQWFVYEKYAIAYFSYKNTLISIGGLLADTANKPKILKYFLDFCNENKLNYMFLHFASEDIDFLNKEGVLVNQLGASFVIDYKKYSMQGKRFQQIRNKINKAKSKDIQVSEIKNQASYLKVKNQLRIINNEWLNNKDAKLLKNIVIDFESIELGCDLHKIFVATHEEKIIAYIIYSKNFGTYDGWFHNLSRNTQDSPNGVMQLINKTAMETFGDFAYLSFGFTPLVDVTSKIKIKRSNIFNTIIKFLENRGGVVYPAKSQRQYKMSWRPQIIEPEYIAFPNKKALISLYTLLKSTNSI